LPYLQQYGRGDGHYVVAGMLDRFSFPTSTDLHEIFYLFLVSLNLWMYHNLLITYTRVSIRALMILKHHRLRQKALLDEKVNYITYFKIQNHTYFLNIEYGSCTVSSWRYPSHGTATVYLSPYVPVFFMAVAVHGMVNTLIANSSGSLCVARTPARDVTYLNSAQLSRNEFNKQSPDHVNSCSLLFVRSVFVFNLVSSRPRHVAAAK
jgi:hypothetical protein